VIRCTGVSQLPFEGSKGSLIALPLFDFQLVKALDHRAVLNGRHVVNGDLSDGHSTATHQDACSPDTERHDWHQFPMPKVENQ
jgi:hypothetical protein